MKTLILACVAVLFVTVKGDPTKCDFVERFKLRRQWEEVFGLGEDRIEFGVKVFQAMFKNHPESKKLFTRVHGDNTYSHEFKAHVERVLSSLDLITTLLSNDELLRSQLAHLKSQHDTRGIDYTFVENFMEAVLEVLPEYLGVFVDQEAWVDCMEYIVIGIFKGH